jgi:hypothetical protein
VVKSEPDKTTPKTTVVVEEVQNDVAVVQGIKSVVDSERTRNQCKK